MVVVQAAVLPLSATPLHSVLAPTSVKVTVPGAATEDIEARVTQLERSAEASKER